MTRNRPHAASVPARLVVTTLLLALSCFGAARGEPASEDRSDYDVRPGPPALQPGVQPLYVADNPANDLRLEFSEASVLVTPRTAERSWWFSLGLVGVGGGAGSSSPGPARLRASGNRIEYEFENVTQRYVNSEGGLELAFTITAPPPGRRADGDSTLTLDLALRGNLTPAYTSPSYFVDLIGPGDEPALRYGDVRSTDANGVILPARIEFRPASQAGGEATVQVFVEAGELAYPITVTAGVRAPHPSPMPVDASVDDGSGEVVGNPMTLEPGITETVEQIMERDRLVTTAVPLRPRETHHELEAELDLQEDPNAPVVSHWPPLPQVESAPVIGPPSLPQTVGTSFKGIGISEAPFIPPDTMGDVGPTQIVFHSNGRIKSFTKAGVADGALNATDTAFWSSVAPGGISDPEVRYDRLSGRWILLAITIAEATNNKIVVAVSSGPTIVSSASFTFYSFSIGTPAPADATSFCDYPSLGVDANAIYTGCNMFSGAGAFRWTSAFVIRKSSVLSGGPIVVTGFANITGGCGVTTACGTAPCTVNAGPYSPRGVDNDDPLATEGYFIGGDICFLSRMEVRRVSSPGGTPTLSSNIAMTIPTTTNLLRQQASGSTTPIDPSDLRSFMASIHKNKLTGVSSLWTAQSVETTPACVGSESTSTTTTRRIGARWHEIGNLTTSPTLSQAGTLCTTTTGAMSTNSQRGFIYPTVVETGQGHMALSASHAAAAEFAGIAAAGRLRTDPAAGTRAPETIVQTGLAAYTLTDAGGRNRWGDYSFTDVDPNDDQTVWTFQEYADLTSTCPFGSCWSVRAVQLKAPPPPALASATPVCVGLASTVSTITGTDSCAAPTCTNGLCTGGGTCPEFFDPGLDAGGPGFANHLSATATGGVTVNPFPSSNIVIPGIPSTQRVLQATLSLNTTAATPGTKDLTITNPDGQAITGIGVLTVNATPTAPTASNDGPICELATLQLSASTVPGATYSWTGPNGFASGAQNPSIAGATAAASGIYSVTVTVGGCTSTAATTTATVTADGGACDDGSACTLGDSCQAGACGGSVVVCTPLDECHVAGICDTGTGICSNPIATDGTACSDGDVCTQVDACAAGTCTGTSPVVCTALDDCHVVGTCDTGTGLCSNPAATDGTACSDGDACTQVDACAAGTCNGTSPVVCTALDDCHVVGSCDIGTGICSNPAATDGTSCTDGNPCTAGEACAGGACGGGIPVPPPSAATGVAVDDAAIGWDSLAGAVAYDVVRGSLGVLHTGGDFTAATEECLADDLAVASLAYTDAPAAGQGSWFLVRGIGVCGIGTYDSAEPSQVAPRDAAIQAAAVTCP
jgi:hypothetical protein